jgi:hypothetical protein
MASTHWCNEIGNLRCRDASQARTIWHESSLGDFEAASTDQDHAVVIANWKAVGVANYLLKNWSRFSLGLPATWIWGMGSAWIWGM